MAQKEWGKVGPWGYPPTVPKSQEKNYPPKMNECPLKGTILKGNELSEPTINFHGILYVSFQG